MKRTPRKADNCTGTPFSGVELLADVDHGLTQIVGRQAFGFKKSRLSLRISLSNSSSATIFFKRWFSF